jgi:hypothetical protein
VALAALRPKFATERSVRRRIKNAATSQSACYRRQSKSQRDLFHHQLSYELIKKCQLEKNGTLMNCPALAAATWKTFTAFRKPIGGICRSPNNQRAKIRR